MYESHFGFHRQPFQCAELTRSFFVSQSIRTIVPQLLHALRSDLGIAVLTGPVGAGKTTLLRHLQATLSSEGRTILCSGASLESPLNVLQTLHTALNIRAAKKATMEAAGREITQSRWTLLDQLQRTSELWGPVLLLIDDAQLLPVPVLNELRAFTEEEWNGRSLIRCLIAGPLSLEEELARPTHTDFSHRIRCHAFLQPLTTRESLELLERHLEAVGGQLHRIFTSSALELIASACDGLPRCLSLLADESLVIAAERNRTAADDECVRAALGRLQHLPYPWSASPLREDEASVGSNFVEDHSASQSAVRIPESVPVNSSPGVIEFGVGPTATIASGTIEFGETTSASLRSRAEVEPNRAVAQQFEIGSRFEEDLREAVETDPGLSDLLAESPQSTSSVASESEDIAIVLDSGYAISWSNLEESFSVTEFQKTAGAAPAVTSASHSGQSGHPLEHASATVDFSGGMGETTSAPSVSALPDMSMRADDRWLSASTGSGFTQRLPVFDRYTWVSLGREVPSGSHSVRSSSQHGRAALEESMLRSVRPESHLRSFGRVQMYDVSAEEIDRRLSRSTGGLVGDFVVQGLLENAPHSSVMSGNSDHVIDVMVSPPVVGVEFYNPPELAEPSVFAESSVSLEPVRSDENRRAIRDAILSRLSQVDGLSHTRNIEELVDSAISTFDAEKTPDSGDSHWMDGQLVFGSRNQSHVDGGLVAAIDADNNSNQGQQQSEEINSESQAVSSSDRGTFFTLPPDVNVIPWDLRSEAIDADDFLPIAQSLSALQSEVSTFHQAFRRDDANRRSELQDDRPSEFGNDDSASVVAQARRRLEDQGTIVSVGMSEASGAAAAFSDHGDLRTLMAAEEPVVSTSPEVKRPASFGQLFTRLRQVKRAAGEN